jgi:hypothetical protein
MTNQLIASVISIAISWGLAWLVAKGNSFLGRVPNVECFYWFGGMWTLVAVLRIGGLRGWVLHAALGGRDFDLRFPLAVFSIK